MSTGREITKSPGWHPHLGEEHHEAAVVGELQVSGVELMEGSDVTLDQVLLLVVQLVQICEKQSVSTDTPGPSCYKQKAVTVKPRRTHSP